ncbi:hypothetical protein Tco_1168511, partial [Tanacetum coccineum]
MVAAITGFWCHLHSCTPEPSSCRLPLHIHVSTCNGGSKPVGNTEGSDIERSDLGGNIGVLGNVTTDIGSSPGESYTSLCWRPLVVYYRMLLSENRRSLLNPVFWRGNHMVAAIIGFWGSKPVGNTEGSDIKRSDLGGNISVLGGHLTTTATSIDNVGCSGESYTPLCWRPLIVYYRMLLSENATGKLLIFYVICHMVAAITGFWCRLHTRTPEPPSCDLPLHMHVSTRNGGSKPVGNTEGSDIERSDLGGNIGALGNVTTDIGSCGTSDQVVFLISYFTSGHSTTTTTFIDNVGSPGKAYTGSKPMGNTEGSDIERFDIGRNIGVLGNVTTDIGS